MVGKQTALILTCLLVVIGCASQTKRLGHAGPRERLFPDGVYRHDVSLKLPKGNPPSFDGIVKLSPAQISIVGLGPLGNTIFRIVEDRATGKIETKIFQSQLREHEKQIVDFYSVLRQLMLLKATTVAKTKLHGAGYEVDVVFESYDGNGIPERMELRLPAFSVHVRTVGYEA